MNNGVTFRKDPLASIHFLFFLFLLSTTLFLPETLLALEDPHMEISLIQLEILLQENHPQLKKAREDLEKLERELEFHQGIFRPQLTMSTIPVLYQGDEMLDYFNTNLRGEITFPWGSTIQSHLQIHPQDGDYSFGISLSQKLLRDSTLQISNQQVQDIRFRIMVKEKEKAIMLGEALLETLHLLFLVHIRRTQYQEVEEDLKKAEEELEHRLKKKELGMIDKREVQIQEILLEQKRLEQEKKKDSLEEVQRNILLNLGLEEDFSRYIIPLVPFQGEFEPDLSLEEYRQKALICSLDLLEASEKIRREEDALKREREKLSPEATLSANYSYHQQRGDSYSVMLIINHTFVDGGRRSISIEEREKALAKARDDYEKTHALIVKKVEGIWNALYQLEREKKIASLNYELKDLEVHQGEVMVKEGLLDKETLARLSKELTQESLKRQEAEFNYLLKLLELDILSGRDPLDTLLLR